MIHMLMSSGGGIAVDPIALTQTAPRVQRAAQQLHSVGASLSIACIDVGDPALGAALDTFDLKWSQLVGQAADATAQLSTTITSAAGSYEAVDTSVMPAPGR
jgi:uncharacterized protein YukE